MSLSTALCRPTSSRNAASRPAGSKSAAACRPPVWSKDRLRLPQGGGQAVDRPGVEGQPVGEWREVRQVQRGDGRLAAHPAGTRRVEMAFQPGEVHGDARAEFHPDDVGRFGADRLDVRGPADDALGEQEARGEFVVRAGGAHRDGHALVHPPAAAFVAELDFERFLDGEEVVARVAGLRAFHADDEASDDGAFHDRGGVEPRRSRGSFNFKACRARLQPDKVSRLAGDD